MPIAPGTRFGPYEIVSVLGAGGMGEVYQAKDTRLERTVAIKVLLTHLTSNPDLKARFEREAKLISSLQHTNICVLHDVGQHEGTDYLVMEYLEGETLATRIARKPLTLPEVLKVGAEIADALDKAHKSGIVHRDLKPGNVMLTKSGAKLMDFGLAKPSAFAGSSTGSGAPAFSATISVQVSPITTAGAVVGTVQYMSPEQITGKEADARCDIFAFGAMLYEMLTGKRAFEGKSQLSVASAILEKEPEPIATLQPLTPPALEHVVKVCLAKEPDERWQSIADVKRELMWIQAGGSSVSVPTVIHKGRQNRERMIWAAAVLMVIAMVPLTYWFTRPKPEPVIQASIQFSDGIQLGEPGSYILSPDGKFLAITTSNFKDGKTNLYYRAIDSIETHMIANTEGAFYPFWSPDSHSIAFFADGKLKKITLPSGAVQTLCDALDGRGGAWNRNGMIVFSPASISGLFRVSASGGKPEALTKVDNPAESDRWPQFLPDDDHILYLAMGTAAGQTSRIKVISLKDGSTKPILEVLSFGHYSNGEMFYVQDKNLMAQPFDEKKLELKGEAVIVAENIRFNLLRANAIFSTSDTGLMVYANFLSNKFIYEWFTEQGVSIEKLPESMDYFDVRLSPDGTNGVFGKIESKGVMTLWLMDMKRGVASRFADNARRNMGIFSPDGKRFAYCSNTANTNHCALYVKATNGMEKEKLLVQMDGDASPMSWSPDGQKIIFYFDPRSAKSKEYWVYSFDEGSKPYLLVGGLLSGYNASFSNDGKWFAYTAKTTNQWESFIANFQNPNQRMQVTSNEEIVGGFCKGSNRMTLFAQNNTINFVDVDFKGDKIDFGKPYPILPKMEFFQDTPASNTADCKRWLVGSPLVKQGSGLTLTYNWPAKLSGK